MYLILLILIHTLEYSSVRCSCLGRLMGTRMAGESNPDSVGLSNQDSPSLYFSPTPVWCNPVLMGHQTGET
ncbi:rCG27366 [Rattus norvegicus]|uniref:RCG27366 n=1 Tax=Rattus norvegicus TaxID=10116 RepID=A6HNQ8_RAT|nr:rCG27366 [Rattus norvegicus]